MTAITQKDIAKALGVSRSTVSKALNDSHEIGLDMKNKIINYAIKNNFKPNRIAQSLKVGHSNTIGVIISSFNITFIGQILEGIHNAAAETGHDIIIMQTYENEESEKNCLETLVSRGVDGILIAPVSEISNIDLMEDIQKNSCPIVLFDRINSNIQATKIGVQEIKSAFDATKHLFSIDRKKILFITGDKFTERHPRLKGYKNAFHKFDVPFNPKYIISCDIGNHASIDDKISKTLRELENLNMIPDAILGATDTITIRALGVLAELKIEVPKQIAVIGFCNTDNPSAFNPSLSTIRQPASEIGFLALKKLAEALNSRQLKHGYTAPETILLDTTLQFRNSTSLVLL